MLTLFRRSAPIATPTDPVVDPLRIRDLLEHPQLRHAMGLEPLDSGHPFVARLAPPDPATRVAAPDFGVRANRRRLLESAA